MSKKIFTRKDILWFIDNFKYYQHTHDVKDRDIKSYINIPQIINNQFTNGFCYHFAHMLKQMFDNKGKVKFIYPVCHFVWYYNGRHYDCSGEVKNIDQFLYVCDEKEIPKDIIEILYYHRRKLSRKKYLKVHTKLLDLILDKVEGKTNINKRYLESLLTKRMRISEEEMEYVKEKSKWYKKVNANMA